MVGDNTFFKDDANGAEKIKQQNEEQMPHKQDDEGKVGLKQVTAISHYIFTTPKEESR